MRKRSPTFSVLLLAALALTASALSPAGCSSDPPADPPGGTQSTGNPSGSSTTSGPGGAGGAGGEGGAAAGGGGNGGSGAGGSFLCPTPFTYHSTGGEQNLRVAGEWQGFDLPTAVVMAGPSPSGDYTASIDLPPGLHAYKLVSDLGGQTQWVLDPVQGRRKYVGGIENSAVKVADCRLPSFKVDKSLPARPAPGAGTYDAELTFRDGIEASGPDAAGFEATLDAEGDQRALTAEELTIDPATGDLILAIGGLTDGKYTVILRGKSQNGMVSEPLRLVFWIEAEAFSWQDALIYMAVTDRYRDGDPANNPPTTPDADPRGDWQGGDFEGLRQSIAAGKLDALGVRAIWLTPFQTNPVNAYLASDGVHKVTGYHGYWPIKAREVDPRLGGEQALRALVKEAHAHGIRILQDFVMNHVHEDHEYVSTHPDWFRTGCVCGTNDCDWTAHALDCMFAIYMPDINHTVPEANAAFVGDAVAWLDDYNLDGLRVDAVKHVEEVATRNLAAEVREAFEPAGTRYFLMGETAMGWNDCSDPCNDENYNTISRYIGPYGLDGQFDFVLYHGVSYRTFAYGDKGMLHAAYWVNHGLSKWPAGAVMTPYIGSHDTPRFGSLADYRGQDAAHDRGIPGNQWNNIAVAPTDGESQARARVAMAWLLGLPGAPLLYYGDEYGQWGGADPNNRVMWRDEGSLNAGEATTLAWVQKLGAARQAIAPLRRGAYVPLAATEDTLVFARLTAPGQAAIVGLTRAGSAQSIIVSAGSQLGLPTPTVLHDAMGGPDVTVNVTGDVELTIPAQGAVVLAP